MNRSRFPAAAVRIACAIALACAAARADALTDLAQAPIPFLVAAPVKPNILFILDDSGSMQWSYLGDDVIPNQYENAVGYRSSLCNKVYYDPQVRYEPPPRADGSLYPQQPFGAASYDGFRADAFTVDLGSAFMAWRSSDSVPPTPAGYTADCWQGSACREKPGGLPNRPGPAHYFVYKSDRPDKLGSGADDDHCRDTGFDESGAGARRWIRVPVGARSGPGGSDETQNFANWFSYYRTRMLAMKTAVGRAFAQLDGNFRVGFSVTSEPGADASRSGFLRIADFTGDHRRRFYEKLYAVVPMSSTPLRAALSKAGRLYTGRLLTGTDDPVQYSCQQNYAILSTDGYWNIDGESAGFGPLQMDGRTPVGNVDATLPRPMYDGSRAPREYRVSTVTIGLQRQSIDWPYSGAYDLRVNGRSLMAGMAYIQHRDGADLQDEAARLASMIAAQITLGGYRAFAEQNRLRIVAPASAGALAATPEVVADTSLPISASAFAATTDAAQGRNTLADVAAYYFENDLRSPALGNCGPQDRLCENNVPVIAGRRGGPQQHMVTHTVGLGANGLLRYRDDYETATDGDFRRIVDGRLDWPDPIYASGPERIDDLWHAAVNGGGRYFNARTPEALARALAATMAQIRAANAAASASATSSQEPVAGDDLLFASRYRSLYWDGDLEARRISLTDGSVSSTVDWSAATRLALRVGRAADQREIFIPPGTGSRALRRFRWNELDAGEQAGFTSLCAATPLPGQCAQLTDAQKAQAGGANLVNYLRGQTGYEDRPDNPLRLFRRREQPLGAPVNAQPLYVGPPAFRYADANYAAFRDGVAAGRKRTLYLAANDGMLHAFDADSGDERWAFIPAGVLPQLRRSADIGFATGFRYLLDGTPVAADICPSAPASACDASGWRTVLVGGLGAGGREYYALDITDPERPAYLWRFSSADDTDLGFALGRPVVAKRRDGRWVVLIASGYNNVGPGSGRGLLFVLDAGSGELLARIDTGAGSAAQPAGLAQLNAWVDNVLDNTVDHVIGGDLLGNVWRFDLGGTPASAGARAPLLAQLLRNGAAKPVTTRPEMSLVRAGTRSIPVVSVATGRYLGVSDVEDKSVQSVYTFTDVAAGHGDLRSLPNVVRQQLSAGDNAGARTVTRQPVDWLADAGWYLDFDVRAVSGERVSLDPQQQLGELRVVTNVPDNNACRSNAESWMYALRYLDGSYVPLAGDAVAGRRISTTAMAVGASLVRIGTRLVSVLTDETGKLIPVAGSASGAGLPAARRVSWRELD